MERDHFDRLSPELITPILLELSEFQSLHSLIRASPKCYQVFLASKERILISLMHQKIQPAAFIDALAAVKASQLKEKGPDRKDVLAFLRKYENKRHKAVEQKERHHSLSTAVSLCQLYRSSQYFIKDLTSRSNFYLRRYKDTALDRTRSSPQDISIILEEYGSAALRKGTEPAMDRDDQYAPLSDVEEGRLQRAFYRYELYTQIFSSGIEHNGKRLWEIPAESYFFLTKYQHWEIEELGCVVSHLWSLLSHSFDRIEPTFVGSKLPEPPWDDSETRISGSYERSMALRAAKYKIHSLYMDCLMNLSLPFLQHVLRLDRLDMQREMSSHIYYDGQKRSLSTVFEGFWKRMTHKDSSVIHKYYHDIAHDDGFQFQDTIDGSNEGWLYVFGDQDTSPFRIQSTTRSLGYVFWDSQRLRSSGFMGPGYVL